MSLVFRDRLSGIVGFPRVSGDEPEKIVSVVEPIAFSPRERG